MKIALYGVSAAGKDHLIADLVKYFAENGVRITHIPGSATLNDLSMLWHGRPFSTLRENEKAGLRARFADEVTYRERELKNVVVDGHYAFYAEDDTLVDVLTDADLAAYDLFFYLDTDAETISQRLSARGHSISLEKIRAWQEYEIEGLGASLLNVGKELHVIRDDGASTLLYVRETMEGKWSSVDIAKDAIDRLRCLDSPGVVCLVDCDKTLIEEDATSLVLKKHGVCVEGLVNIYERDRYTNYQSFMADQWLDENLDLEKADTEWICSNVTPNQGLITSLANRPKAPVVAVTASSKVIWRPLLDRLGIDAELLDTNCSISKYVKYAVVKELQRRGFYVIAVGDSMLDSLMLEQANRSYVYAGKGRRESMAAFLERNPHIRQFSYCTYQYPRTSADESVCWVDCLDQRDVEIASDIAVCKSSSGSTGRVLREAHRRLGARIGRRIVSCFADEDFVVVIMMRSGLPLGEGIADELDCPLLFFDGDSGKLIETILEYELGDRRLILADGVVNTGRSLINLTNRLDGFRIVVSACVVSSTAKICTDYPVFSARVSDNSYVGARQWEVSGGKGPDTADRLFRTM